MKQTLLATSIVFALSFTILMGCFDNASNEIQDTFIVKCPSDELKLTILHQLELSRQSWNKGDMEGYMSVYCNSDSLLFMGSNKITRGWETTLNNYKKAYPDERSRGRLDYTFTHFNQLADDCLLVIGRFYLTREIGNAEGNFSLIWKKINGEWKIIQDHT